MNLCRVGCSPFSSSSNLSILGESGRKFVLILNKLFSRRDAMSVVWGCNFSEMILEAVEPDFLQRVQKHLADRPSIHLDPSSVFLQYSRPVGSRLKRMKRWFFNEARIYHTWINFWTVKNFDHIRLIRWFFKRGDQSKILIFRGIKNVISTLKSYSQSRKMSHCRLNPAILWCCRSQRKSIGT